MSKKNKSKEPAKKAKHKAKVAQLRQCIAELEAANIEHRQVAEAYQLMVEHSGQGLAIFQNQRLIFANPGLAQISGRSVEELTTLSAQELFTYIHPDDRERVIENIQNRLAGQPAPERYEIRFFHQTGRLVWLELSLRLIQYQGQPAIQITYFDMTERKQAEEKLHQRTAQLEALRQIGLDLTSELNLDSLLYSIVSRAIELLGATTGGLYLYRPEDDRLELVVAVGPPTGPTGLFLKRGEGLSGQVLATGQPMVVDNYHEWAGRADIYTDYDFKTVVGVPVQWGQELLGVLNIANRRQPFTAEEVELLNLFTTPAAAAIRNARLVSSLQKNEADLAHERDLLQALMDNLPDPIYFKDTASHFTRVNRGHAEVLEYGDSAYALGKTDFDLERHAAHLRFLQKNQR